MKYIFSFLLIISSLNGNAQSKTTIEPGFEFFINTKGSFIKPELIVRSEKFEIHPGVLLGKRYLYQSYAGGLGVSSLYLPVELPDKIRFYFKADLQMYNSISNLRNINIICYVPREL